MPVETTTFLSPSEGPSSISSSQTWPSLTPCISSLSAISKSSFPTPSNQLPLTTIRQSGLKTFSILSQSSCSQIFAEDCSSPTKKYILSWCAQPSEERTVQFLSQNGTTSLEAPPELPLLPTLTPPSFCLLAGISSALFKKAILNLWES